ncbi:MAG: hypothetical protein Q9195_000730 [Heterodermia aff. obscurata]
MGSSLKDESTENAAPSSPTNFNNNDTQSEEQATAGAPNDPPDYAIDQAGFSSAGSSSDDYSDNSLDGRSRYNDTASFASSRKIPFHRRLAKAFRRSGKIPLYRRAYGPRVPQKIRSLDGYPQGYGKVAAIESCDPNFLIYRKFAWLHNRLLLHYSLLLRMQKIHSIKTPTKRNQSSLWKLVSNTQSQVSLEGEASNLLTPFKHIKKHRTCLSNSDSLQLPDTLLS